MAAACSYADTNCEQQCLDAFSGGIVGELKATDWICV
jgi:hypothetical protein